MIDTIGWIATVLFGLSYLFKRTERILAAQVVAAITWVGYGLLLPATPVVVANFCVAAAAAFALARRRNVGSRACR